MHYGAQAYSSTAKVTATANPRELEASLLLKAAAQLKRVQAGWPATKADLGQALLFNRKLWTILTTSATSDANPLPLAIKNNIGNLGVFVLKRTLETESDPAPEKLDVLISINQNIAAGLSGR